MVEAKWKLIAREKNETWDKELEKIIYLVIFEMSNGSLLVRDFPKSIWDKIVIGKSYWDIFRDVKGPDKEVNYE